MATSVRHSAFYEIFNMSRPFTFMTVLAGHVYEADMVASQEGIDQCESDQCDFDSLKNSSMSWEQVSLGDLTPT